MPLYNYQCLECGLRFQSMGSFEDRHDLKKCPRCKEMAERAMPTTSSSVVDVEVKGPGPQNTGYASLDAHIDRVIGRSSEQGWRFQEGRFREKSEALRKEGLEPGQRRVYRESDGAYRPMTPEEQVASAIIHRINTEAMDLKRKERRLRSQT